MSEKADCLIVGGGVIGLTLAWELAGRGRSVTVLERGQVGREASWAGAGILPPPLVRNVLDPLDQLRTLSHELHVQLAADLKTITGIDNGLRRCGGLYLASTVGEQAALAGAAGWFEAHGVQYEFVTPERLIELEPQLAEAVTAGRVRKALRCEDEWQLRNPRHLQALHAACRMRDVRVLSSTACRRLRCEAGRAVAAVCDEGEFTADTICLSSGAWLPQLLQPLGLKTGVFPVRGQMVLYRCPEPPLTHILNEGPRYIVPRDDGHCLVGSSEEEVGYAKQTTSDVQDDLEQFAARYVPALESERIVDRWAGLRPASFDGFPYIGAAEIDGLYLAVGHFRSGIHLSTGTARLLAQQICGEPLSMSLDAFTPGRG